MIIGVFDILILAGSYDYGMLSREKIQPSHQTLWIKTKHIQYVFIRFDATCCI